MRTKMKEIGSKTREGIEVLSEGLVETESQNNNLKFNKKVKVKVKMEDFINMFIQSFYFVLTRLYDTWAKPRRGDGEVKL